MKLENQYYCKKCKTIAQIEFMVYSQTKPNPSFFEDQNKYGTDLKCQNELIEQLQIEEESVFNWAVTIETVKKSQIFVLWDF